MSEQKSLAPTRPVTIRFNIQLWTWLRIAAARDGRSASNLLQQIVRREQQRRQKER